MWDNYCWLTTHWPDYPCQGIIPLLIITPGASLSVQGCSQYFYTFRSQGEAEGKQVYFSSSSRWIFVRSHFVTASHSLDVINLARIFPPSERKTSERCLQNVGKNTQALASFISKRWKNAALSVQICRDCSRELMPTAFASISLCRPHTLEVTNIPVLVLF